MESSPSLIPTRLLLQLLQRRRKNHSPPTTLIPFHSIPYVQRRKHPNPHNHLQNLRKNERPPHRSERARPTILHSQCKSNLTLNLNRKRTMTFRLPCHPNHLSLPDFTWLLSPPRVFSPSLVSFRQYPLRGLLPSLTPRWRSALTLIRFQCPPILLQQIYDSDQPHRPFSPLLQLRNPRAPRSCLMIPRLRGHRSMSILALRTSPAAMSSLNLARQRLSRLSRPNLISSGRRVLRQVSPARQRRSDLYEVLPAPTQGGNEHSWQTERIGRLRTQTRGGRT